MARTRALLMCVVLAIAACSGNDGADSAGPASSVKKHSSSKTAKPGPSRDEQTAGMVLAAAALRSADIAELKFDLPVRPQAGQPFSVELALLPTTDTPLATLELNGSEGLTLAPEDTSVSFPDVSRAHVYRKSVAMTPAAEGVYFLSVLATFKNSDFSDSRSFTIPIIVEPARAGGAPGKPQPAPGAAAAKSGAASSPANGDPRQVPGKTK